MTNAAIGAWCETLVWVLCHSLWQAALVAALVWLALRQLPARRANLRYAVAVLGLALVVLGSLVTWSVLRLEPAVLPAGVDRQRSRRDRDRPSRVPLGHDHGRGVALQRDELGPGAVLA